jgi:hypothetical protein
VTGRARPLPYGFIFGPATVARLYADQRGVGLEVETKRDRVQIDISAAGLIEILYPRKQKRRRR